MPNTAATAKTAKASQRWARTRFLWRGTAHPPLGIGTELFGRHDLYPRQHLAVPEPAKFVARHQEVAGPAKHRMHLADITGHYHRVDVCPGDQDAVDHVGSRQPQRDLTISGDDDAWRHKGKL